jgi:hypothetical protein
VESSGSWDLGSVNARVRVVQEYYEMIIPKSFVIIDIPVTWLAQWNGRQLDISTTSSAPENNAGATLTISG